MFEGIPHGSLRPNVVIVKQVEYGVYGNLIIIYPKPYFIHLRGTIPVSRFALLRPSLAARGNGSDTAEYSIHAMGIKGIHFKGFWVWGIP